MAVAQEWKILLPVKAHLWVIDVDATKRNAWQIGDLQRSLNKLTFLDTACVVRRRAAVAVDRAPFAEECCAIALPPVKAHLSGRSHLV